jgi:hypothetical protein
MGKNLNPFGGPQPTNRPTAPFRPMHGLANHRVVTAEPSRAASLTGGALATSRWRHCDVAVVTPSLFLFRWRRRAKVSGSPPWRRRGVPRAPPRHLGRPRAPVLPPL